MIWLIFIFLDNYKTVRISTCLWIYEKTILTGMRTSKIVLKPLTKFSIEPEVLTEILTEVLTEILTEVLTEFSTKVFKLERIQKRIILGHYENVDIYVQFFQKL